MKTNSSIFMLGLQSWGLNKIEESGCEGFANGNYCGRFLRRFEIRENFSFTENNKSKDGNILRMIVRRKMAAKIKAK